MRIPCPCCGPRDRREFTYYGSSDYLDRPEPDAGLDAWNDHLHLRDNPAGVMRDLWYHDPCAQWVEVERDTRTHEILSTRPIEDAAAALRAAGAGATPAGGEA